MATAIVMMTTTVCSVLIPGQQHLVRDIQEQDGCKAGGNYNQRCGTVVKRRAKWWTIAQFSLKNLFKVNKLEK